MNRCLQPIRTCETICKSDEVGNDCVKCKGEYRNRDIKTETGFQSDSIIPPTDWLIISLWLSDLLLPVAIPPSF